MEKELLKYLFINRGKSISGAQLASMFNVTRSAIWKAIKNLQKDGYEILANNHQGYQLTVNNDVIIPEDIMNNLTYNEPEITYLDTVSSTNDYVKLQDKKEGYLVIAANQEAGKGRLGRNFFSPKNTGLYFSLLLKPKYGALEAVSITTMAGLCVAKAIKKITNQDAKIKWVNDVLVENKKVCGILTEAIVNIESGSIEKLILGIGINVYQPQNNFPKDIIERAGYLLHKKEANTMNQLISEIVNTFMDYYLNNKQNYIKEYKEICSSLNKNIMVIKADSQREAFVVDIDDQLRLHVKYENGEEECLSSGEISIRE